MLPTLMDILDRATRKPSTRGEANGFSNASRIVFIPIFKISANRHIGSGSQGRSMRKHGCAIDFAVRPSY
jgi:hypothetical protein